MYLGLSPQLWTWVSRGGSEDEGHEGHSSSKEVQDDSNNTGVELMRMVILSVRVRGMKMDGNQAAVMRFRQNISWRFYSWFFVSYYSGCLGLVEILRCDLNVHHGLIPGSHNSMSFSVRI